MMETTILREKLHAYIDMAGDDKIAAMYTILEEAIEGNDLPDKKTISMLYERRESYLKGETKAYTVADSHERIRQKNKK